MEAPKRTLSLFWALVLSVFALWLWVFIVVNFGKNPFLMALVWSGILFPLGFLMSEKRAPTVVKSDPTFDRRGMRLPDAPTAPIPHNVKIVPYEITANKGPPDPPTIHVPRETMSMKGVIQKTNIPKVTITRVMNRKL